MRLLLLYLLISTLSQAQTISVKGLTAPVEVLRDENGVNHIYAQNEHDLFFTQGYCAAKDRLFQFEIWRRQATGTVAEILGSREVQRDIGSRLFKFRGDLKKEFNHYHPHGEAIINAFTDGINAYISETEKNPKLLPIEFGLLGIKPGKWKPEIVISRHQGLLNNITEEVNIARAVITLGQEKVKQLLSFEPGEPDLTIHPSIKKELLLDSVLAPYQAFRKTLRFTLQDIKLSSNNNWKEFESLAFTDEKELNDFYERERTAIGSNNWIVSGGKSQSGFPILANDPHRVITVPSLRYMVHLNAPGWNVLGGGEPTIPGISIGHNEHGAWGLTVFDIDAEDLYVYELNPNNPRQYKYKGQWENMKAIADTIHVKGAPDVFVEHLYTRHGPVTFSKNNVAFAARCGWLDVGSAPYLASLRIDQAKTLKEFMQACTYSYLPGENMIWADKKNNIAWQAVGVAPVRKNWSGLVPVPGDGSFEWDGYLSINKLPSVTNPAKGFWATANENNVPENYPHRNAVSWTWAERYRVERINEVLQNKAKLSLDDMMALQFDYLSLPARQLVPLLERFKSTDPKTEAMRQRLLKWNFVLHKDSVSAAVYVAWEKQLASNVLALMEPETGKKYIKSMPLNKVIYWLMNPPPELGGREGRDKLLLDALYVSIADMTIKFGNDSKLWKYGHANYHHILIKHPLSNAVNDEIRKQLDMGPLPRGGYGQTPGMTTSSNNQQSGASFRIAVDTKDWDSAMFTNTPGQSGDPSSKFYKNLFESWAKDKHFHVYFSKDKIDKVTVEKLKLVPK